MQKFIVPRKRSPAYEVVAHPSVLDTKTAPQTIFIVSESCLDPAMFVCKLVFGSDWASSGQTCAFGGTAEI